MTFRLTAVLFASLAATASAMPSMGDWSNATKIDDIPGNSSELNTAALDGCPVLSPDGRSLYMASNRAGGHGGLDIWVARRDSVDDPFGAPENLPAPINSAADDFCPTPLRGNRLLCVSRRTISGVTCGMGDMYLARRNPKHGWGDPAHLACAPDGPNTGLDEQGPSYIETDDGIGQLYFSRSATGVQGDIYMSEDFGPASPVSELNTADNELQPNVRHDGREVVFSSNHAYAGARGSQDIYAATRASTDDPWGVPVNLGPAVNSAGSETRPSLSWDGRTLLFGLNPGPEGSNDIYMSTR